MFLKLLSAIFILSVCLVGYPVFGNEKAAEHGEKSEGKEGEAKAEGKSEAKDEYAEAQNKVATLQAKIKASEEIINKLIEEKQTVKEATKVNELIKNLVSEHKTMEKNAQEYDKALSYLQYRFPEKGLKGKRTYERFDVHTLDEMEHEMTMGNRLKKTMHKVRKQYHVAEPIEKETKSSGKSHKKSEQDPALAEPVILTK